MTDCVSHHTLVSGSVLEDGGLFFLNVWVASLPKSSAILHVFLLEPFPSKLNATGEHVGRCLSVAQLCCETQR